MVRQGLLSLITSAALLSLAVLPVSAQGFLEQAERDLANIVRNTRGGIVSIEDGEGFLTSGNARNAAREAFQEVRKQAEALFIKREEIDGQLLDYQRLFKANHPKIAEAQRNKATAQTQLENLLKESEGKTDTRAVMERIENDYLKSLDKKRVQQESELAQAKKVYVPNNPRIVSAQLALDSTNARMAAVRTDLDNIRREQQFRFFQARQNTPKSGSGFSLGEGYVVTTADVLEGMKEPIVITDAGMRIKADRVGIDGEANVGLLRLQAKIEIPALKLGDSDQVVPGHFAISIGNQAGQPNSVALNMVAGVRSDGMYSGAHFYPSLIQIAGTIGVGSSGAPVLNARGEVVGVIAAIPVGDWSEIMMRPRGQMGGFPPPPPPAPTQSAGSPSASASGPPRSGFQMPQGFFRPPVTSAGYAIPINAMQPVIADLRAGKPISHSWVGLLVDTTQTWVENAGIIEPRRTIYISALYPESPAVQAGLQVGDIVVQMNGVPIQRSVEVRMALMRLHPGDTLTMQVHRPTKDKTLETKTLELKVASRPATFDKPLIHLPKNP